MSFGGSSKPPPLTPEQVNVQNQQNTVSAQLDAKENERRKRLLSAAGGLRMFRGAAPGRAAPGNTVAPSNSAASGSVAPQGAAAAYSAYGGGWDVGASLLPY